jgi:hypothetical protein
LFGSGGATLDGYGTFGGRLVAIGSESSGTYPSTHTYLSGADMSLFMSLCSPWQPAVTISDAVPTIADKIVKVLIRELFLTVSVPKSEKNQCAQNHD